MYYREQLLKSQHRMRNHIGEEIKRKKKEGRVGVVNVIAIMILYFVIVWLILSTLTPPQI